jgi:hypothetical protein
LVARSYTGQKYEIKRQGVLDTTLCDKVCQ